MEIKKFCFETNIHELKPPRKMQKETKLKSVYEEWVKSRFQAVLHGNCLYYEKLVEKHT